MRLLPASWATLETLPAADADMRTATGSRALWGRGAEAETSLEHCCCSPTLPRTLCSTARQLSTGDVCRASMKQTLLADAGFLGWAAQREGSATADITPQAVPAMHVHKVSSCSDGPYISFRLHAHPRLGWPPV